MRHFPTAHNSDDPSKERIRGWGSQGVSDEGKAMERVDKDLDFAAPEVDLT
jgi:hypothetical protein